MDVLYGYHLIENHAIIKDTVLQKRFIKGALEMNSLVVFYSFEGHTRFVADIIAEQLNCDTFELKPVKDIPNEGFLKFFLGGMNAIFRKKPKLRKPVPDLNKYDMILIGTPVWASSFAPSINTFLSDSNLNSKKVSFFLCYAGENCDKCVEKLSKALKGNEILGKIGFKSPAGNNSDKIKEKTNAWLSEIKKKGNFEND